MNRSKTSRIIIWTAVGLIVLTLIYLALNGKHNKLPGGVETNIPAPIDTTKGKRDTVSIYNDHHIDNSKKVVVPDNHGRMTIKM